MEDYQMRRKAPAVRHGDIRRTPLYKNWYCMTKCIN